MLLTDYTAYEDIRATLGVSDEDLEDATLALPIYLNLLQADLEDINLSLPETYATTKASLTPTPQEARFLQAASVFATFSVAKQLCSSLPLFAAKQVTDSKASVSRFDNPYRDVVASVDREYVRARNRLAQALAAIGTVTGAVISRPYLSVVAPASDPITGT